jgi:hypothetical protein
VSPVTTGRLASGRETREEGADGRRNVSSHGSVRILRNGSKRGKLTFTGDVLQVISVFGRQQKFGKLLKRLAIGA